MNPNIENGYLKKGSQRISDLNSVENPQHVWVFFFFLTESKFFVDTDFFSDLYQISDQMCQKYQ